MAGPLVHYGLAQLFVPMLVTALNRHFLATCAR